MVDPISDVGAVDEDEAPVCGICGETILPSPDHRVVTWVDEETVHHRHFCSPDCRDEWLASNDPRSA